MLRPAAKDRGSVINGCYPLTGSCSVEARRLSLLLLALLQIVFLASCQPRPPKVSQPDPAYRASLWVMAPSGVSRFEADTDEVATRSTLLRYDRQGVLTHSQSVPNLDDLRPDGRGMLWASDGGTLHHLNAYGHTQLSLDSTSATGGSRITALAFVRMPDPHSGDVWVADEGSIARIDAAGAILRRFETDLVAGMGPILVLAHYVDVIAPAIRINNPVDGSYFNDSKGGWPVVHLSYSDVGAGVALDSLELSFNRYTLQLECEKSMKKALYPELSRGLGLS